MKVLDIIKSNHELDEAGPYTTGLGDVAGAAGDAIGGLLRRGRNAAISTRSTFMDKILADYASYMSGRRAIGAPAKPFDAWFAPQWQKSGSEYFESEFARDPKVRDELAARAGKAGDKKFKQDQNAIKDAAHEEWKKEWAEATKNIKAGLALAGVGDALYEVVWPAWNNWATQQDKINKWVAYEVTPNDYAAGKQKSDPKDLAEWKQKQEDQVSRIVYTEIVAAVASAVTTGLFLGAVATPIKILRMTSLFKWLRIPPQITSAFAVLTAVQQLQAWKEIVEKGKDDIGNATWAIMTDPKSQMLPDWILGPIAASRVGASTGFEAAKKSGMQIGSIIESVVHGIMHPIDTAKDAIHKAGIWVADQTDDKPSTTPTPVPVPVPAPNPEPNPDTTSTTSPDPDPDTTSTTSPKPTPDKPDDSPSKPHWEPGAIDRKKGTQLWIWSGSTTDSPNGEMFMTLPIGKDPNKK
jgi:hypothetical protein